MYTLSGRSALLPQKTAFWNSLLVNLYAVYKALNYIGCWGPVKRRLEELKVWVRARWGRCVQDMEKGMATLEGIYDEMKRMRQVAERVQGDMVTREGRGRWGQRLRARS